jgi:hypothetical protein
MLPFYSDQQLTFVNRQTCMQERQFGQSPRLHSELSQHCYLCLIIDLSYLGNLPLFCWYNNECIFLTLAYFFTYSFLAYVRYLSINGPMFSIHRWQFLFKYCSFHFRFSVVSCICYITLKNNHEMSLNYFHFLSKYWTLPCLHLIY